MLPNSPTLKTPPPKPWLAALLNLWPLPLGIGYIYLRRYIRFACAFALQILLPLVLSLLGAAQYRTYALVGLLLYIVVDAYQQAQKLQ